MQRQQNSGHILVVIFFLVILAAAIVGGSYFFWQHQQDKAERQQLMTQVNQLNDKLGQLQTTPPVAAASPVVSTSPTAIPTPSPALTPGNIQGKLSYPSEVLPKQKICAVSQSDPKLAETCIQDYQGNTYKLVVPPGTYQVYAALVEQPGQKAYYSEFVTCGLKYGCPSHKPIDVVVKSGETIQNIDPGDWYAGQ